MFELSSIRLAYESMHCVDLRCECGNSVFVETNNFETVKEKYVVLKENVEVTCDKCGTSQPLDERYIPLENQHSGNLHIPQCPTCGSYQVQRISTGKKLVGYAAVGVFSSNFMKTYECKNCKYKW